MRSRSFTRLVGLALLVGVGGLTFAAPAQAKLIRKPLGPFGSAEQQSFANPAPLAVDQGTRELYVLSGGSENQSLKVSATAGTFRLKFEGEPTADIPFEAPSGAGEGKPGSVQAALEALPAIGAGNVEVREGPGNATGSNPYRITFRGALANTDLEQLTCENGITPLSGGSGCSVTTTENGEPEQVTRWNADGTPSAFSALGTNAIDGKGPGEDQTPENDLSQASYIAIDESGGATDGDIYVSRRNKHVLDAFSASGKYLGQLTGFKEGPKAEGSLKLFSADSTNSICGVAVDQAGDLYVGETIVSGGQAAFSVHKYHPGANPVANADNVANFTAVSQLNTTSCDLAAGAGPTTGYIFSSGSAGGSEVEAFKLDSSTGEKKSFLAVKEKLLKGSPPEQEEVEEVVPLRGVSSITVDLATGHVFAGTSTRVLEYDASGSEPPLPRLSFGVANEVKGLATDGTSGNLYVVRRSIPQIDTYGPVLIVPDVTTEAATEVAGTSANVNGTINAANGPNSSCHFQYTTEAAYQADRAISGHDGFTAASSAPCEPAGPFSGSTTNAVSAKVSALNPEEKYVFRIVGENENSENMGERERTIATPCPGGFPTCPESFETLGKPAIEGGLASEITTTTAKISGEVNPRGLPTTFAVQYLTQTEFEASGYAGATITPGKSAGSSSGFAEVFEQLTGLQPLTTYHFRLIAENESGVAEPGEDGTFTTFVEPTGLPEGRAYEQVSPAVKLGEVFPPTKSSQTPLIGTCFHCVPGWLLNRMPMQFSRDGDAIAYEGNPFAEGLAAGPNEYIANRGAGGWASTPLSGPEYENENGAGFRAFSDDLSRGVLYQQKVPLDPDALSAGYADLYLWQTGGGLMPLITSEPPNRAPYAFRVTFAAANRGTSSAAAFSHVLFEANDALTSEEPGIAPAASSVGEGETDLYEWSEGQLHLINVLPGNNAAAPNAVIGSGDLLRVEGGEHSDYDHAISDDGNRVFWSALPSGQVYVREVGTETVKVPDPGKFLTASPDGSKVLLSDGHIFNLEDESTTDLTEGQGGFQGTLGTAEDLSRVYFVDTKALTSPGEENTNGEHAEEGKFNLYLNDEGATTFIGKLETIDNGAHGFGNWRASPGNRMAQVSPDGRYLAFQSGASLTGYDNSHWEVFEYDAQANSLSCASCNPTGQRPLGPSHLTHVEYTSSGAARAPLPEVHNLPEEGEGRLFFESQDILSADDHNGSFQDVYEWRPEGVGGCVLPHGCIDLISGGKTAEGPHAYNQDSYFVDASPSGKDAFFAAWNQLVPQDKDNLMDLYDARVGGGFEFSAQEPCLGEACRGAGSSAPELQSPGTAGFSEAVSKPKPGCKKGTVKRRGRCVTKKKRHHKRAAKHNSGGAK
jgi:hypothetical protein